MQQWLMWAKGMVKYFFQLADDASLIRPTRSEPGQVTIFMKINVHLTRKEYNEAAIFLTRNEAYQVKKTRYKLILSIFSFFLGFPSLVVLILTISTNTQLAIFYVISILSLIALSKINQNLYRRYWEKLPLKPESLFGPKEYLLTDTGLRSQWSYGTSEVSWDALSDIVQIKDITLLIFDENSAYIFPQRCFQTLQDHEEFCSKVKAFIGIKVNRV